MRCPSFFKSSEALFSTESLFVRRKKGMLLNYWNTKLLTTQEKKGKNMLREFFCFAWNSHRQKNEDVPKLQSVLIS